MPSVHSPLSEIQATPCLALYPEVAGRYFFQCFLYPNGAISVSKGLDVVFAASREPFAEGRYESAMKMSHGPAAGSLRSASGAKSPLPEETWPPTSSASLARCRKPPDTSPAASAPQTFLHRLRFMLVASSRAAASMRQSTCACGCKGASTLAWLMRRVSRGGYCLAGFPLRHPRLCLPG